MSASNACQICQETLSSCPSHRLEELFSHNAPPNADETLLIRHASIDDAPLLASLEEQIAHHTRELARATLARDSILAHPDHVKSLLHPIRSLPEDILLVIFMFCTQGPTGTTPDSLNIYWAPWVLSQVCRRWRFSALSLPRLWTRLDLARHYYDRHWNAAIGRLLLYLNRSGSCALTVNVQAADSWQTSTGQFMQALRGSVHRWQSLTVGDSIKTEWFSDMDFTNLIELHISYFTFPRDFPDVPNLRVLDYEMYKLPRFELRSCPWSRLTRLRAHSIDRRLLDTLPTMVELQRLELRVSYGRFPSPCPSIFLPSVTSLLLSETDLRGNLPGVLLNSLCMPALQELELVFGNYGFPDSDAEFELEDEEESYTLSFRSFMRLDGSTVLHITSQLMGDFGDNHVEVVRVSCNVERLTLRVRVVPRGVRLDMMDRTMLPEPRTLDIRNCGLGINSDAPELLTSELDEVRERWGRICSSKKIRM